MTIQTKIAADPTFETECFLVGSLFMDARRIDVIADMIAPQDFSSPILGAAFDWIVAEHARGGVVSPVAMRPTIEQHPHYEEMGGWGFLAAISTTTSLVSRPKDAAKIIAAAARKRRISEGLRGAIESGAEGASIEEMIDTADAAIVEATETKRTSQEVSGVGCMDRLMKRMEEDQTGVSCRIIPSLDDLVGTMRRKQFILMAGRPGMGKAQPLSTKVLTKAGWRSMGSLKVGDELASVDGSHSVVTGVFPQGYRQVFRVTFSDGRSTQCCGEHLWKVRYRDWPEDRILSTDKVREMLGKSRYRNRLSIDLFSGEFGFDDALPLDPWLLGFLLGDGSICGGQVRFSTKDPEIVEAVQARLPDGLTARYSQAYDYKISGGSRGGTANPVMDALRTLGVYDTRSHDKFVPAPYLAADRQARVQLLRGLMDSDGWAETFGAIRFSTASEMLAHDVCTLVRSIGGICSVRERPTTYTYKGEKKIGRMSYTCRIRLADPAEVFTLPRKIERVGRVSNTARLNFASIEPVAVDEVQCISVSHPSRLYITDDFTVTHNTAVALSYALGAAQNGHGVLFVSLEMSAEELAARAAADLSFDGPERVPYQAINDGCKTEPVYRAIMSARERMADMSLTIIDAGSLTIGRLNMLVRRIKRRMAAKGERLDLVVVDYLQLLRVDGQRRSNYETVSEISVSLKALAKDNDIAVLALAQLSREVEKRPDKRPQQSDLRDSGQLEQDADTIIFLLREEYYLRKEKPEGWEAALEQVAGKIEFICAKRRNGPEGTAEGTFYTKYQAVRG